MCSSGFPNMACSNLGNFPDLWGEILMSLAGFSICYHYDPPTPHQDLRAAAATRHLQDAIGQGSANQLFVLLGVSLVERSAICGNQVCEAGERAPADINNLGGPS